MDTATKTCIKCNETKDVVLFKRKTNVCKKCRNKIDLEYYHTKKNDPIYREKHRAYNEKAKRKKGIKKRNNRVLYTKDQINSLTRLCQNCNNQKELRYFRKTKVGELYYPYGSKCESCCRKINMTNQKSWQRIKSDSTKKEALYRKIAQRRKDNPDKFAIIDKKSYEKVKADPIKYQKQLESVRLAHKKYDYKHLEKAHNIRKRDRLYDSYVANQLVKNKSGLFVKDIPKDLIELKRKQLLLTRKIKQHAKEKATTISGGIKGHSN